MASYPTITNRWWLVTFAGFILVLIFFSSHSFSGYNVKVLQNLTVPKRASIPDTIPEIMQSPLMSSNYIDNKDPAKSSDQLSNLDLQSCTPLNFTYSEKPAKSSPVPFSGLQHSEPISDFSENIVKPVEPSQVPSSELKDPTPTTDFTAAEIEATAKVPKQSKFSGDVQKLNTNMEKKSIGRRCSIFNGKWVYDPEESPLYDTEMCPFLTERARCQRNGRPDKQYERWRWEANECKIPRFNAMDMLERLRGKRVVIVGDSIGFGQWESLACLLYSVIPHKSHVDARNRVFISEAYKLIIESKWAEFLVEGLVNKTSGKRTLKLDSLSSTAWKWKDADIIVFNTGHWWMSQRWDSSLFKQKLYTGMKLDKAFKIAMETWARWIKNNVDKTKTTVFFRGISPVHFGRHKCHRATQPIKNDESFKLKGSESLIKGIVEKTIDGIGIPVKYLNITKLTGYRKDAHSSFYWMKKKKSRLPSPDCSHWCLPGLPDTWNYLLYATMVLDSSMGHF